MLGAGETVPARIVADLSNVTFMDSSGINVLIAAHLQTKDVQGWVRIAGASRGVLRVLQVTGVDTFTSGYPSVEQALIA
ncbi:STAS domain-containing protein [Streptomyces massasporeus]|uniref:STAS domain-containing protein n=1 Tax=Streptomyces massasporeus TaxID=67324 RepID=UPI00380D9F99